MYGIQRADQLPNIIAGALIGRIHTAADLSPDESAMTLNQFQATLNLSTWELDASRIELSTRGFSVLNIIFS